MKLGCLALPDFNNFSHFTFAPEVIRFKFALKEKIATRHERIKLPRQTQNRRCLDWFLCSSSADFGRSAAASGRMMGTSNRLLEPPIGRGVSNTCGKPTGVRASWRQRDWNCSISRSKSSLVQKQQSKEIRKAKRSAKQPNGFTYFVAAVAQEHL